MCSAPGIVAHAPGSRHVCVHRIHRQRIIAIAPPPHPGTLPAEWSDLAQLSELRLANNHLVGTMPWFGNSSFTNPLRVLDVTGNNLSGNLIPGLGLAEEILLGYNRLSGNVGTALDFAQGLVRLSAPYNLFTGTVPYLAGASRLTELDLRGNMITGSLPAELGAIMTRLLLDGNQLSGSLPVQVRAWECSRVARAGDRP